MIAKTYILKNLQQLGRAFAGAKTQKHGIYFSKLAILELCGWIEISMDDIIVSHCHRHLAESRNTKFISNDVVKRTYGFEYHQHFRRMLINLIGIIECEKLEARLPIVVHTRFVSQLDSLKRVRDGLAHTYVKGTTLQIDAPSVTLARFTEIHSGLKAIDVDLRSV